MAAGSKHVLLPMSDPPPRVFGDESLFKGSGMTRRGAMAAVSYMTCADDMFHFDLVRNETVENYLLHCW